jgi:hypothetical protein
MRKCVPKESGLARLIMRSMRFYHDLTKIFPVLNSSVYDLKWGNSYVRHADIVHEIEEDLAKGIKTVDETFGKYCDPSLMEEYYNNEQCDMMEYIANCKDNIPTESLITANNREPMYAYCRAGMCHRYDNIDGLHQINDIVCKCDRVDDNIKYVHIVGNVETLRDLFAYFPR